MRHVNIWFEVAKVGANIHMFILLAPHKVTDAGSPGRTEPSARRDFVAFEGAQ